jgi:hypothetical protein
MSNEKSIVVTAYGQGKKIDKISVMLLEGARNRWGGRNSLNPVEAYCKSINSLELKGDAWIYARTIEENNQYSINSFLPSLLNFHEVILMLDSKAIQKVLRVVAMRDIAVALKITGDNVREAVFNNMSKRAVEMLKEDMDYMGTVWTLPQKVHTVKRPFLNETH